MSSESNPIQIFQHPQFGEIRSIVRNETGEPWFVASDIATTLGYLKPNNAINNLCKYALKQGIPHPQNPGKSLEVNIIPESDVYRLIMRSKLPQAEAFQDWVVEEVLPAIRKRGYYSFPHLDQVIQDEMVDVELEELKSRYIKIMEKYICQLELKNPHIPSSPDAQTNKVKETVQEDHIDQTQISEELDLKHVPLSNYQFNTASYAQMVKVLGANEAIILSQLQQMISEEKNDSIKLTYRSWLQKCPYKSKETLRKTVRSLEDKGIIKAERLSVDFVRSKSYSIDYDVLEAYTGLKDELAGGDV